MKALVPWALFVGLLFGQGSRLPAPTLLAPAENAEIRRLPRDVVFEWSAVPGAESYTLEIEFAPDHVTSFRDLQSTTFRYEFLADLHVRWRVGAIKGFLENDKAPWRTLSFGTGDLPSPPQAPQMLSPANGVVIPPDVPNVTFEWSPVAGATSYVLEVDRVATCGTPGRWCSDSGVYNLSENIPGTAYSLNVSSPFLIRWRVWAVAGQRASLKSPWSVFQHPPVGAPPPRPDAGSPASPPSAPAVPPAGRAVVVKRVAPEYSDEARAAQLQGVVTVFYEVDTDGAPRAVKAIRGLGMGLDEKAVEAVEHWRFDPPPSTLIESVDVYFDLGASVGWSLRHAAYTVITEDSPGTRSGGVERPLLSHYTPPSAAACLEGVRTVVTAYLHIDKKGVPSDMRPGSTPAAIAISDAVRSWRFRPAQSNGSARAADGVFTLVCNPGPPAEAAPARVGRGVSQPSVISQVNPEYSEAAMQAKREGEVELEVTVDTDGFASNIRVIRSLGLGLDERAIEAAAQWRFNPGMSGGKPVPVAVALQMLFRLH